MQHDTTYLVIRDGGIIDMASLNDSAPSAIISSSSHLGDVGENGSLQRAVPYAHRHAGP